MEDFAKGPSSSSLSNGASSSSSNNSFDKIEVVTHCGEESSGSDGRRETTSNREGSIDIAKR